MRLSWLLLLPVLARADASIESKSGRDVCVVQAKDGASYYDSKTEFWTPSAADVARLEAKLAPFLDRQRKGDSGPGALSGYLRQYVGIVVDGKKLIHIYAWHRFDKEDACSVMSIKDGGCGVWRASFDVKSGRLRDFACNGRA